MSNLTSFVESEDTAAVAAAKAKADVMTDMAFDRFIPPISHPIATWAKRIDVILRIRNIDMDNIIVGKRLGVFIIIKLPSYLATVAQSNEKLKDLLEFPQTIDSRPKDVVRIIKEGVASDHRPYIAHKIIVNELDSSL